MKKYMVRVKEHIKNFRTHIWAFFKDNVFSILVFIAILVLGVRLWGPKEIEYKDVIETVKISVTVLISMLGFSVSIYVFLNNTFQSRRNSNELEKEVIDLFQAQKRKSLLISITFSALAITAECVVTVFAKPLLEKNSQFDKILILILSFFLAVVTLLNVYKLVCFTYGVINYEEGLKELAKKQINTCEETSCNKEITKGEFLNLVNNIEVLVDRLVRNHLHAKISTAYDSNLKRAICDGITEPGDINTREKLAENYKEIIDYRNLLLQDTAIMDSDSVTIFNEGNSFK